MIEVRDLVVDYTLVKALKGVSFRLPARSITALVGPNGAGKTTLLRCMAALQMPTLGRVVMDGLDTREDPRAVHGRLGYVPETCGLYDALTVRRVLGHAARAQGIVAARVRDGVDKAVRRTGLKDWMEAPAGELPRRLRQRLAIAQAIIHEPRVLLLDDPASGLDPQARRDLSQLLLSLREAGLTLVISSHILAGMEDTCSEMIILEDGRVSGDKAVRVLSVERTQYLLEIAAARSDLREFLAARAGVDVLEADQHHALITHTRNALARAKLIRDLLAAGFHVSSFGEAVRLPDDATAENGEDR